MLSLSYLLDFLVDSFMDLCLLEFLFLFGKLSFLFFKFCYGFPQVNFVCFSLLIALIKATWQSLFACTNSLCRNQATGSDLVVDSLYCFLTLAKHFGHSKNLFSFTMTFILVVSIQELSHWLLAVLCSWFVRKISMNEESLAKTQDCLIWWQWLLCLSLTIDCFQALMLAKSFCSLYMKNSPCSSWQ